ncbi:hypothetical protein HA49_23315 [Tatumella morbirosei]|uniref:Uncharacterized protein n=1 Tax=Tatumella morbirosei TaxID=642227 RepID=A0A0F5BUV9_9GAMM|nr:hypothetical protein HA49_23315 [Tatumella morbirosei]
MFFENKTMIIFTLYRAIPFLYFFYCLFYSLCYLVRVEDDYLAGIIFLLKGINMNKFFYAFLCY